MIEKLNVFVGRWITEGETAAVAEIPSMKILASDVYQWLPGGHFIMHPAYGRIGQTDVGGLELIGCDSVAGSIRLTSSTTKEILPPKHYRARMVSGRGKASMRVAQAHSQITTGL